VVREQVVKLALEHPDQSSRQVACLFTDEQGYFISESSVYRILKGFDLVESPAFRVISAKDKFQNPTKQVNELWHVWIFKLRPVIRFLIRSSLRLLSEVAVVSFSQRLCRMVRK
jgi:hypothetical protein